MNILTLLTGLMLKEIVLTKNMLQKVLENAKNVTVITLKNKQDKILIMVQTSWNHIKRVNDG